MTRVCVAVFVGGESRRGRNCSHNCVATRATLAVSWHSSSTRLVSRRST